MKKVQSGFTLIEVMIVVTIIAILAAVALPAYQNYTKRSHVSEGLSLASGLKASMSEYYSAKGTWPAGNPQAGAAISTDVDGSAVKEVYTYNGVITIVFNEKVDNGKIIELSAVADDGSIEWVCRPGTGSNPINETYLPARCRT